MDHETSPSSGTTEDARWKIIDRVIEVLAENTTLLIQLALAVNRVEARLAQLGQRGPSGTSPRGPGGTGQGSPRPMGQGPHLGP